MICIKLKLTNCFLIPVNNKYLLVDTGYEFEYDDFTAKLQKNNINLSDIDYLFITHCHDDHVGFVSRLKNQNPKLKLIISQVGTTFCQTGKHNNIQGSGYINKRIAFVLWIKGKTDKKWTHTFPKFSIQENDIIVSSDCDLNKIAININARIIMTPGHTLDHMSLVLNTGECISGDAAANFPGFLGLKKCIVLVNDLDEYYKSWERMIEAGAKRIIPSHGEPFCVEELKRNIRKNKKDNMVLLKQKYLMNASS